MALTNEYRDYPTTSTSAFGRIFYGLDNRLMFSQVLVDDINTLGRCYQKNDPTSPEISDVLATDGGEVLLQNSGRILRIEEYQQGVLAFCERGVWYVFGPDSGFTATNYAVNKVTEFPLYSIQGVVNVGDVLFYIAENGLYAVQTNEFGRVIASNVTESTIDTYYKTFVGRNITATYNPLTKQILYINSSSDKGLIQDLRSEAFYPQEYMLDDDTRLVTSFRKPNDNPYFLYDDQVAGDYNFLQFTDTSFEDVGNPYNSYLVTAEESLGQFTHRKNVPNIYLMFKKTEENITGFDGSEYTFDKPSGCQFRVEFDYANSASSNMYTYSREVYRPNRRAFTLQNATFPQPFDDGRTVVEYRDMIRGSGKSCRFRFEAEDNKDLQLLGYSVEFSMRGRQ